MDEKGLPKNDLSAKEEMIMDYMKNALRGEIDPYDLRYDSAFTEMFLSPQASLFLPILTYIDNVRFAQSLSNPHLISEERLDEIGDMFNNSRKQGSKSHGYITMTFDDIPDNGYITIPKGMTVRTKNDLIFVVEKTYMFDEVTIANHYDPSEFLYKIPVLAYSQGLGKDYNISPHEIIAVDSRTPDGLISVTNESPFVGGRDLENNVDYAARIRREMWSKNLGINRGYQVMVNSFEGVEETEIVGYRHPYMKRDIIGVNEIPGIHLHPGIEGKHWGSKVDIYIRGGKIEEVEERLPIKYNRFLNNFYVEPEMKPIESISSVTVIPQDVGLDPREVDFEKLVLNDYSLFKKDDFELIGTIKEISGIAFSEFQLDGELKLKPGDIVTVRYKYNATPQEITDYMYNSEEENRPPTADVKVKTARKKYVSVGVVAGMRGGASLQLSDELSVKTHLRQGINSVNMGGELQISDLIEHIYTDDNADQFNDIDFIELPFQCLTYKNNRRLAFSAFDSEKLQPLYKFIYGKERDVYEHFYRNLTMVQLLDILYILSRKTISNPDPKDDVLTERIEAYNKGMKAYKTINLHKILSPSTLQSEPIEYFALSLVDVKESKKLNEQDWVDFDEQLHVLSQIPDGSVHIERFLLVVIGLGIAGSDELSEEEMEKKIMLAAKILGVEGDCSDD